MSLLEKTLSHIAPMPVWRLLRLEFYLFRVRMRKNSLRDKFKDLKNALINFGAGSAGHSDWVNVDAYPAQRIDCIWDCRYPIPLPSSSARGVFTEHFLEHLDYEVEAPAFLKECHRIMQSGARIRIVVPDAEAFLRGYVEEGWTTLQKLRLLSAENVDPNYNYPYRTKMQLINVLYRQFQEHKYAYDYDTLADLLFSIGFSEVRRCEFGKSDQPELAIDLATRAQESLYVEAMK